MLEMLVNRAAARPTMVVSSRRQQKARKVRSSLRKSSKGQSEVTRLLTRLVPMSRSRRRTMMTTMRRRRSRRSRTTTTTTMLKRTNTLPSS